MGQKPQDGKNVLEMSQTNLHSKSRPVQTIHPTDLNLLPSWISILRQPAQEFSPAWNARKRVQEMVKFQENPGNLYFQIVKVVTIIVRCKDRSIFSSFDFSHFVLENVGCILIIY